MVSTWQNHGLFNTADVIVVATMFTNYNASDDPTFEKRPLEYTMERIQKASDRGTHNHKAFWANVLAIQHAGVYTGWYTQNLALPN